MHRIIRLFSGLTIAAITIGYWHYKTLVPSDAHLTQPPMSTHREQSIDWVTHLSAFDEAEFLEFSKDDPRPEHETKASARQQQEVGSARLTTSTEVALIEQKLASLDREHALASRTMMLPDYQQYLDATYNWFNVMTFYDGVVPDEVYNALLDLRDFLEADEQTEYLYMMPHIAAYHLLASQLLVQYQTSQAYGTQLPAQLMLSEAISELNALYGDCPGVIYNWFETNKLPRYSNLLVLYPSQNPDSIDNEQQTGFQEVIAELFPDHTISQTELKSVSPLLGALERQQ